MKPFAIGRPTSKAQGVQPPLVTEGTQSQALWHYIKALSALAAETKENLG